MSAHISLKIVVVVLLAVAIATSFSTVWLGTRGPVIVTQTQVNYATQMISLSYTSSTTLTQMTTLTVQSEYYQPVTAPQQQYCGYPFNPYACNEGPPTTIIGYLTVDSSCVDVYTGAGINYVVWNLPKPDLTKYQSQDVEVYGFIYPDWPSGEPFPPNPFQQTICVGVPMWAIPPYIQSFS